MANEVLNSLLREYEQKKLNAEIDLDRRKEDLYKLIPRLDEIDSKLNSFAINTAKSILSGSGNFSKFSEDIDDLRNKMSVLKAERESILKQNGYSLDYLKPFYECKVCNDTGFVTDEGFNTKMCNCLKQRLLDVSFNKSNISNSKKNNFNSFNELLYSDEVDLAKYKFNISPRKNISNIKNKCLDFIRNFDDENYKNLLFVGSTGLR